MFPAFERCFRSTETEAKAKRFIIHLGASRKFSLYFKDVGVSKCDWVRNPFDANNFSRLTTCEQEQLIDTFCDGSLKDMFGADKLPQFWLPVKYNYPSLSDKTTRV